MNGRQEYIIELIVKQLQQSLTADETAILDEWKNESAENRWFLEQMNDRPVLLKKLKLFKEGNPEISRLQLSKLMTVKSEGHHKKTNQPKRPVPHLVFRRWWMAAASIIILFGLAIYINSTYNRQSSPVAVNANKISAPATNRAVVTLANGTQVLLDSVDNGQLAQMGNVKLVKLANGQIAYQTADGQTLGELQYNTLTNPQGSKVIDLQLSDGSHVWLNAGSSIKYPVAFVGAERDVELKGEGYFEVAPNKQQPFRVKVNTMDVTVLGTHFNINAYSDEPIIKTTLIEGAVKVSIAGRQQRLTPGQQVQVSKENLKLVKQVDMEVELAWKNNEFNFKYLTDLKAVLRQLARWYDLDIIYEEGAPVHLQFKGAIPMDATLSQVLEVLSASGVRLRQEGRTLTVLP